MAGVVANANVTPAIYYVHTDHLLRPARMTDNVGAVAWDVIYKPFGEVNNVAIISAATDLRFPGQWFQLESGLHYNWHRHYDPTTGRYIQPDPLGLTALRSDGPSAYNYVGGSPLVKIDPRGEFAFVLAPAIGWLGGVASTWGGTAAIVGSAAGAGAVTGILLSDAIKKDEEKKQGGACPVPGASPGQTTKGKTRNWDKPGDMDTANDDFDNLGPRDVQPLPGGGRRGVMPDGRDVNVRPNSTDGRPTLEVQNGGRKDKVRYGDK